MAYELPIGSSNVDKLIDKINKAAKAFEDLDAKSKAFGKGSLGGGGAAREEIHRVASRRGGPSSPAGYDSGDFSGPYSRLSNARRAMDRAKETGDSGLIRDSEIRMHRAQSAVDRAERTMRPKTQQDAIWDAINTSRMGAGGKLFPLVNKMREAGLTDPRTFAAVAKAAGVSAELAARIAPTAAGALAGMTPAAMAMFGVAGAATGVAVGAGALAFNQALQNGRSGAATRFGTGSMGAGAGQIEALSGFTGSDGINKAMQTADRLREASFGSAYMRARGVIDYGGATIDKGANYMKSVDVLRGIKDEGTAIRVARDMGLTEELRTRLISDRQYSQLVNSRRFASNRYGDMRSAQFDAQKESIMNNASGLAGIVGWAAYDITAGPVVNHINNSLSWLSESMQGGPVQAARNKANAIHNAPRNSREEMIGAGPRAGSAVPPGIRMAQLNEKWDTDAASLGGF